MRRNWWDSKGAKRHVYTSLEIVSARMLRAVMVAWCETRSQRRGRIQTQSTIFMEWQAVNELPGMVKESRDVQEPPRDSASAGKGLILTAA